MLFWLALSLTLSANGSARVPRVATRTKIGTGTGNGSQECPGGGWTGEVLDENARSVATDRSGERFEVGAPGDGMALLHIKGSPFELGRAHGVLLRSEIQTMYVRLFAHLEDQLIVALHLTLLPEALARRIARLALNAALDATYLLTLLYTPARFVDEMIGLAQGAQVEFDDVVRVQMIPELLQASCSMLGSWGPATWRSDKLREEEQSCGLFQMRALDWDMEAPIVDFPAVIFYHPADGNSFALFTWAGFIGCVTGYSGRLGISEKVWANSSASASRKGMPWHFALRDVLQLADGLDEATQLLGATSRTCPILVGIGSRQDNKFVLLGYSSDALQLYDDTNFTLITSAAPPPADTTFPGVVFVDKYVQPSDDRCMQSVVQQFYGKLDDLALLNMASMQETGGMHTALYDFASNEVLFSWAASDPNTGELVPAYKRNYLRLNMTSLANPIPRCPSHSGRRELSCM